jgi:hypothetical protein
MGNHIPLVNVLPGGAGQTSYCFLRGYRYICDRGIAFFGERGRYEFQFERIFFYKFH